MIRPRAYAGQFLSSVPRDLQTLIGCFPFWTFDTFSSTQKNECLRVCPIEIAHGFVLPILELTYLAILLICQPTLLVDSDCCGCVSNTLRGSRFKALPRGFPPSLRTGIFNANLR